VKRFVSLSTLTMLLIASLMTTTLTIAAPTTTPTHLLATALTATASVSNAAPAARSNVTVTARLLKGGKPVAGATVTFTWKYKTSKPTCSGMTNAQGYATCTRNIGKPTKGYKVVVAVNFRTTDKLTAAAAASFTPK